MGFALICIVNYWQEDSLLSIAWSFSDVHWTLHRLVWLGMTWTERMPYLMMRDAVSQWQLISKTNRRGIKDSHTHMPQFQTTGVLEASALPTRYAEPAGQTISLEVAGFPFWIFYGSLQYFLHSFIARKFKARMAAQNPTMVLRSCTMWVLVRLHLSLESKFIVYRVNTRRFLQENLI